MRSFRYESREEHARPAMGRRPETDAARPAANHKFATVGAAAHMAVRNGLATYSHPIARRSLLQLQQSHGNQYVQRAVELARKTVSKADAAPDVEREIEAARGAGQPLDRTVRAQMGSAFNADFSGVRVHTGSEADSLNRALSARAFTTGQDIFFREGEYSPGSSSGRGLLAHELTHVVQQNGEEVGKRYEDKLPQAKLSVSRPGDQFEREADRMAQAYTLWEQQGTQAIESGGSVRRQATEEEKKKDKEKPVMAKSKDGWALRQPETGPEKEKKEELVRTKVQEGGVQLQVEEEEQELK